MTDPLVVFARNVQARRWALDLTQEKVADRAHMNSSYWSKIERAKVDPSVRTVVRIACALETAPAALLVGIGDAEKTETALAAPHLGERRRALVPSPVMPPLSLAPPGPSVVSCDCCLRQIPPGAPMATLEVVGPENRDEARPIGDYCEPCWRVLSSAWDVIEELGHPKDRARRRP